MCFFHLSRYSSSIVMMEITLFNLWGGGDLANLLRIFLRIRCFIDLFSSPIIEIVN